MRCCCNHDCEQGRACPYRARASALARALLARAVAVLCIVSAALALAVWLLRA